MKNWLGLILAIILMSHASARSENQVSSRILDGFLTAPANWAGVCQVGQNITGTDDFFCTGTLIHPCAVLTAGHCVLDAGTVGSNGCVPTGAGRVRFPGLPGSPIYKTTAIWTHPSYTGFRGDDEGQFDISVMMLEKPVPAPFFDILNRTPVVKEMITMVGYGNLGDGNGEFGPSHPIIKVTTAPFDKGFVSQGVPTEIDIVTPTFIKIVFNPNESNAAGGDSGGPAFLRIGDQLLIAGVVSGGGGGINGVSGHGDLSYWARPDRVRADIYSAIALCGGFAIPTIAENASASPNPVTGTTTTLRVRADNCFGSDAGFTYTWNLISSAIKPPIFTDPSRNGTNAASQMPVQFQAAGTYRYRVTILNATLGINYTQQIDVVVIQTLTSIEIKPGSNVEVVQGSQSGFRLDGLDQFNSIMTLGGITTWATQSGNTINATNGLFRAETLGGFTVTGTNVGAFGSQAVNATVTVVENIPPALGVSGIVLNPDTVFVGQQVTFTHDATDANTGQIVTVTWNFGDGFSSTVNSPKHSYTTPGTKVITLTMSDGIATNIATKTITVLPLTSNDMNVTTLRLNADFGKLSSDSLQVTAIIPASLADLFRNRTVQGSNVIVDIGDASATFTLDSKYRARSGQKSGTVETLNGRVQVKGRTKRNAPGFVLVTCRINRADLKAAWADEGIVQGFSGNVNMPCSITLDLAEFTQTVPLTVRASGTKSNAR